MSQQFPLFDKIINVQLVQKSGVSTYIPCPKTGRKPTISVSGKILPSPILSELTLRVTNLLTGDTPLDAYKYLKIEAGYADSLSATIEGEVVNAYQETPGPDGVTIFHMLLGYFTNWVNVTGSLQWPAGTSINTILQSCATLLEMTVKTTLPESLQSAVPYSFSGSVGKFLSDMATALGFTVYPNGPYLMAFYANEDTRLYHSIKYLTTPPRHEAYGYNLTAPWDPTVRPGDIVVVDTRYVRQTFGGAQVGNPTTNFIVQTVSFDFSTTDETNSMVILATAAAT